MSRYCWVEGCGRPKAAKGLCQRHYYRMKTHGSLDLPTRKTIPDELWDTGVTYRQLDYWTRKGYITPAKPSPGSGVRRVWTPQVVEDVRWLVQASLLTLPEVASLLRNSLMRKSA